MHGQTRCRMHGAMTPVKLRAAERRLAEEKLRREMATWAIPEGQPMVNSWDALLEEVNRTAYHVRGLYRKIVEQDPDSLVWIKASDIAHKGDGYLGSYAQVSHEAKPSPLLTLYQQERAHLVQACTAAIRNGIAERQVRLNTEAVALVADVFRATLGDPDFGLSREQQERGAEIASRHLRIVGESDA